MMAAAGCATGVEDEPADSTTDDGGAEDPQDAADGGADARSDGGPRGCPLDMVKVPVGADTYCIDSTEITNQAYAKFLAAKPVASNQPSECAWNDDFEPGTWPAASGEGAHPVVEVDWCDARAYCAWAKKHLCGQIGGGKLPRDAAADANKSQWFNACSKSGSLEYPYGSTFDPKACNGTAYEANAPIEVGSLPTCTGGIEGIFDMSGNVLEWEDACDSPSGGMDLCHVRGGSYEDQKETLRCDRPFAIARNKKLRNVGFRCCREL